MNASVSRFPLPAHFDPTKVGQVWRVPYQQRAAEAAQWAKQHRIAPALTDRRRVCLLLIDCQNTFCLPDFELFVAGRSGNAAVQDNVRLCEFVYRNLGTITEIIATLDTHTAMQIFHSEFLVNARGEHPEPMTTISLDDVEQGRWRVNPAVRVESPESRVQSLAVESGTANSALRAPPSALQSPSDLDQHLLHYCRKLSAGGKYDLMIWPYHAMLGGIGHALVAAVEEACFFHSIARNCPTRFEMKGSNPLTENYSVLRPEVLEGVGGCSLGGKNTALIDHLLGFDCLVVAGQAKSHCVAWTIEDLLTEIKARDAALAGKICVLQDCTSPVVVPGVADFTEQADAAMARFAEAGMHIRSTDSIESWFGAS